MSGVATRTAADPRALETRLLEIVESWSWFCRLLAAARATWTEYATSVAVSRNTAGDLRVIAPHGLDDLFGMAVRRDPTRVSVETFAQRVRDKNYAARWPKVRIDGA